MMISLDGYFEGSKHDLSWHNVDAEFVRFAIEQLDATDTLIFGRRTYEMMASFWSTEHALTADPETAERMNAKEKFVVSRSLDKPSWNNTTAVTAGLTDAIVEMKKSTGQDIAVLGSSNLCVSLLRNRTLDELRLMINPQIIGHGTPLFDGLKESLAFDRTNIRTFESGNVLLTLRPRYDGN